MIPNYLCFYVFLFSETSLYKNTCSPGGLVLDRLKPGTSLQCSTTRSLLNQSVNVACVGTINNYTKWNLLYQLTDQNAVIAGYTNCPFQDVRPGTIEGFASHAQKYLPRGSHIKATYSIDDNGNFLHFVYCLPSKLNPLSTNYIAIATSKSRNESVNNIVKAATSAMPDDAYTDSTTEPAMTGSYGSFYGTVKPVCHYAESEGICVVGTMGTSNVTELNLTIFPLQFRNLAKHVVGCTNGKKEYDDFIGKLTEADLVQVMESAGGSCF